MREFGPEQKDPWYYAQPRNELLCHIPEDVQRVLDVGCGAGVLGARIKARGAAYVAGIELDAQACAQAATVLDVAVQGDVATVPLPFEEASFDCMIFADVLEHLYDPHAVLRRLFPYLAPGGLAFMSIPNIRYFGVFDALSQGRWKYEESGLLDWTHIRFFTAVEMRNLVRQAGLKIVKMQPLCMLSPESVPLEEDGSLRFAHVVIYPKNKQDYIDYLTFQYLLVAQRPMPQA